MINTLIIEDDLMVLDINKSCVLEHSDFNIIAACSDVNSALDALSTNKIDLVLLDLTLPNLDGIDLLRKIKSDFNNIDVIVISARNDNSSLQKVLNLGVIDYILKPFKIQRLSISLNQYKLRKELLNQTINQATIDQAMFLNSNNHTFPKGIDENTLKLVKEHIYQFDGFFSTMQLSEQMGISRISLRKYLKYLESTGFLSSKLEYLPKGRPQIYYKLN